MGIYPSNMAASRAALKFPKHLKELRLHLCQKSATSQGARDFVEKHYVGIKQANPSFPILVRECSNVQPKLTARYELGRESSVPLSNLSADQVLDSLKNIVSKAT